MVACLLLVVITLVRRLVPMAHWSRIIGPAGPYRAQRPPDSALNDDELDVARAVATASRRLPIAVTCLDQAVAASLLLRVRRRSSTLVIGLDRVDPLGGSHAWLVTESGNVVVGSEQMDDYQGVTQFGGPTGDYR